MKTGREYAKSAGLDIAVAGIWVSAALTVAQGEIITAFSADVAAISGGLAVYNALMALKNE